MILRISVIVIVYIFGLFFLLSYIYGCLVEFASLRDEFVVLQSFIKITIYIYSYTQRESKMQFIKATD